MQHESTRTVLHKVGPIAKVGTFTQALYHEVKKGSCTVISMKNDWKMIVPFDIK